MQNLKIKNQLKNFKPKLNRLEEEKEKRAQHGTRIKNIMKEHWLVWLSRLSDGLRSKGSSV